MLIKDVWLSQYFENGAYRYDAPFDVPDLPKGFIYSKIPVEKTSQANLLIQNGFKVMEVLVQFEQKVPLIYEKQDPIHIELAFPEDRIAVAEIAGGTFTFSRFYQDDEIPKMTANQIKSDWVSNYFKGQRGDNMIIAREKGTIIGFLLLIERSTIDLIAVSSSHMGKGVASAMIRFANQKVGILKAGTQLTNKPSISLYEKLGFFIEQAHYILHRCVK